MRRDEPILRRAELWNFKSHEHSAVRLASGINAITGENYAGKTSILQAVGICLFNSAEANLPNYVRKGAKHALIHVEFVSLADERVYRAERRLGSGAYWRVWDVETDVEAAAQEEDVRRFLIRHLRLHAGSDLATLFESAVGVPQGNLTADFTVQPRARKATFNGLLRIDEYETAWEKLRPVLGAVEKRIAGLDQEISRLDGETIDTEAMETRRADLAAHIADAVRMVDALAAGTASLALREQGYARARKDAETARAAYTAAQGAVTLAAQTQEAAETVLRDAETALKERTEAEPWHAAYVAAEMEWEDLRARHTARGEIQKRKGSAETELARFETEAKSARTRIADAQAAAGEAERLRPLVARQRALEETARDKKTERDRLSGELNAARRAQSSVESGLCPLLGEVCENTKRRGKSLDGFFTDRAADAADACRTADAGWKAAEQERETLKKDGLLPDARLAVAESQSDALGTAEADLLRAETAVATRLAWINQIDGELSAFAELDEHITDCKARLAAHKPGHERYLRADTVAGTVEVRRAAVDDAAAAHRQAVALARDAETARDAADAAYDATVHMTLQNELSAEQQKLTAAQTDLRRDRKDLAEADERLAVLRALRAERDRLDADRARQDEIRTVVADLRESIRGAGPKVAELVVGRVSAEADGLFGGMIGDPTVSLRWDADYGITLSQFGQERGLKEAAGSEKVLAALSVRLALVQCLGDVRFAFLDEPTIHLDATRRAALADRLSGFTQFDQLVVISHDDAFEAKVDHVVHVRKIEERSFVS